MFIKSQAWARAWQGSRTTPILKLYKVELRYNITLLTFSHLQFLLENGLSDVDAPIPVWNASADIKHAAGKQPTATQYWVALDRIFCSALGVDSGVWAQARHKYFNDMLSIADKQIAFFEAEKSRVSALSREELIPLAVKALKLDKKIADAKAKKEKTAKLVSKLLKDMENSEL